MKRMLDDIVVVEGNNELNVELVPIAPPAAWLLPTRHNDPDNQWDYERAAYDGDTDTYAENWTPVETWSGPLELTTAPIDISAIRCYISSPLIPKIGSIDLFYDGAWNNIYEGTLGAGWNEISIPGGVKAVTKARFRMYNRSYSKEMRFRLHEFHFWGS